MPATPRPVAFASPAAFRAWLAAHHADTAELLLRLFKTSARDRGLTYRDALDEALCFGWIDGVRRALDDVSFTQRFTPRRRGSRWSAVNVRRAKELIAEERMRAPGLAAFEARTRDAAGYSFESRRVDLAPAFRRRLREDEAAWAQWAARPRWYRRTAAFWVMDAKRDETRERRFTALLEACRRASAIPPLRTLEKATRRGSRSRPRGMAR